MNRLLIVIAVICIIIFILNSNKQIEQIEQIDNKFYSVDEIDYNLNNIKKMSKMIKKDIDVALGSQWSDWPEKKLYDGDGKWTIYPFFGFDTWITDNCEKCPNITKFLKSLSGLKVALLSKLSPHMKLNPHMGWGKHSNNIIRCHYGIKVPDGCYISVRDNEKDQELIKFHTENEWLCFDDSKLHYAENTSNDDRIVLIVDLERPSHIKKGTSDVEDSTELLEIVKYYKEKSGNNI